MPEACGGVGVCVIFGVGVKVGVDSNGVGVRLASGVAVSYTHLLLTDH